MSIRVVITGGSGFLGQAIVQALSKKHPEYDLVNFDITPPDSRHEIEFVTVDVTDHRAVEDAFESVRPDAVIHTAGVIPQGQDRYSKTGAIRAWTTNVNVHGTRNVSDAAKRHGCRALVYTSSCTVITDDLEHDFALKNEDLPLGKATLAYGVSKTAAELLIIEANCAQMATCALRPAIIFGPGDKYGVIGAIHTCIARGETPFVIGDGLNLYDFVYVDNVADAHVLALENLLSNKKTAAGQAFFISNDEPVYFRDFMLAIWAHFGHVPAYEVWITRSVACFVGDLFEAWAWLTGRTMSFSRGSVLDAVGVRYADITRAKTTLGYRPKMGLVEGLANACADYKLGLQKKSEGDWVEAETE